MSVAPERSSSSRASGVPAAISPGTTSANRPRSRPPPRVPTRSRSSGRAGSDQMSSMVRSGAAPTCTTSSARTSGALPSAGVHRSRALPSNRNWVPRPPGHRMSIVDVRRTEPARRPGVTTAGPLTTDGAEEVTSQRVAAVAACNSLSGVLRSRLTGSRTAAQGEPPAGALRLPWRESAMTPDEVLAREAIAHTQSVYNTEGDRGRLDDLLQTFTEDGVL